MKRKTVFVLVVILAAVMLLSSCGSVSAEDYETLYYSLLSTFYKNGMFHYSNGLAVMKFLDFDTMESVPICPRPNCPHTDDEICSALWIYNQNFIYDDKLWWFCSDDELIYDENGGLSDRTILYSADINGTNRMKVAVLDELTVRSSGIYVKNGKVYFEARDIGMDNERGVSTHYDKVYLYSYDLESKEFTELYALKEGYHAGISIFGRYENSLVLEITDGIAYEANLYPPRRYMFYDFDSGEFTEYDIKRICSAQKDWLVSVDNDGTIVVNRAYSDEEYRITDERFTKAFFNAYYVFDETLFVIEGYAYELKTGKIHTTQAGSIYAYYKGKYIVTSSDTSNELGLVALTKKEFFLD